MIDDVPIPIPPIPLKGEPVHIPRLGDHYTWEDVRDWQQKTWAAAVGTAQRAGDILQSVGDTIGSVTDLFGSAASITLADVADLIDSAVSTATTAWGSFVNHAIDYTTNIAHAVQIIDAELAWAIIPELQDLADDIRNAKAFAYSLTASAVNTLRGEISAAERYAYDAVISSVGTVERWAIDHIRTPLEREIDGVRDWTWEVLGARVDGIKDWTWDQLQRVDANLAARIAAVAAVAAAVTTWVDECGAPMCRELGPGSKLLDALKKLAPLLEVLAAAELAHLTLDDLERLAQSIASTVAPAAGGLVGSFVGGGETIGEAAGDLLGPMTDAARGILHELGIPA